MNINFKEPAPVKDKANPLVYIIGFILIAGTASQRSESKLNEAFTGVYG
ncbi:MAG: hypothetical protein HUU54_06525 [Ignavibacteriaceae bacterium]|nr:hypothetical protein [Ignavibacteriaceae bacterium]